jgi:hypothetical protein
VADDPIPGLLTEVDRDRLRRDLYHLTSDPLPFRKLNYARPGQTRSTLEEADDFLVAELEACGYVVVREDCPVQAFRRDSSKPKAQQYSPPEPDDPWYTAFNLYAERRGSDRPDEIVLALAHKDSQSWVDSPGANDNAVGTVALLEIARCLSGYPARRTIRFLFCNEEHRPWTSVAAAENARDRGDNLVAIFNLDAMCGKSQEETDAGRMPLVSLYTDPEGEPLARLMGEVIERYDIGLEHRIARRERPGDDDGSFVNAGFPAAIVNLGSWPYADPNYHTEQDTPDRVDLEHLWRATRASLAAIVNVDRIDPEA